jgi:hypothetical protein
MMILEEVLYANINQPKSDIILIKEVLTFLIEIFKGYIFDFRNEDPPVWVHTMTTTSKQGGSHNVTTKHKEPTQIKVLDPTEPLIGWRLPTDKESFKYRKLIKESIEKDMSKYESFKTYGTILQDGKFRLIDNDAYEKDLIILPTDEKNKDRRLDQKGSEPKSINKKVLIKIAVAEGIRPTCSKPVKKESILYLREAIKAEHSAKYVNQLSDADVKLYHEWDTCSNVAKYFQNEIVNKMKIDGRLYEPYILTYFSR